MTTQTARRNGRGRYWRVAAWGTAALLLLLPLVAMQYTEQVNWTPEDFVFLAVLLGSVGLGFEWMIRKSGSLAYRAGAAVALLAAFLTIWVNAAVGMIGAEDNPFNLLFGGVLLIAVGGAIWSRFKPAGMKRTMMAAALAQGLFGVIGMASDPAGGRLSQVFVVVWLVAALLFRKAAQTTSA